MRCPLLPKKTINSETFDKFVEPLNDIIPQSPALLPKGHHPLAIQTKHLVDALIYYHLQEFDSARHLIQDLKDNEFARQRIAPKKGLQRSTLGDTLNNRGTEQLLYIFKELYNKAAAAIPKEYAELGELIAIDGTLIDAVMSMYWADYSKTNKKAKGHFGFNINQSMPSSIYLTTGKYPERPFVAMILTKGQTSVTDRGYQCNKSFDQLQKDNKYFVCRIKKNTTKTIIKENEIKPERYIFFDAIVLLGSSDINQTEHPLRVVGYKVGNVEYFVATNRCDLSAEQIATIYKLRWKIETFFRWWKLHLKVYHIMARTKHGVMLQILGGLITYLLMVIYCRKQFNEPVSINRVRELRSSIANDIGQDKDQNSVWLFWLFFGNEHSRYLHLYAIT